MKYVLKIFRKTNISYHPDKHVYFCVSGSKKYQLFGKFLCMHEIDDPKGIRINCWFLILEKFVPSAESI